VWKYVPEVWVALWNPASKVTFCGTELSRQTHSTVWPTLMATDVGTKLPAAVESVPGALPIMTTAAGVARWAELDVPVAEDTGALLVLPLPP
jgi:hypothetical protein